MTETVTQLVLPKAARQGARILQEGDNPDKLNLPTIHSSFLAACLRMHFLD